MNEDQKTRPVVHVLSNTTWDLFDDDTEKVLGGPPRFQAPLLAQLGYQTCLHTRMTRKQWKTLKDIFPSSVLNSLLTDFLFISEKATIFRHQYQDSGERTSFLLSNAGNIPLSTIDRNHFNDSPRHSSAAIILSPVYHELNPRDIIKLATRTSSPMFLDPQGFLRKQVTGTTRIEGATFWNLELFNSVDVIKLSDEEAANLQPGRSMRFNDDVDKNTLQESNLLNAATIHQQILQDTASSSSNDKHEDHEHLNSRLKMIILTKGSQGAEVSLYRHHPKQDSHPQLLHYLSPAFPTTVKNPTGAGDAFLIGFIHGWNQSKDVKMALAMANSIASIQISTEHLMERAQSIQEELTRRTKWCYQRITSTVISLPAR